MGISCNNVSLNGSYTFLNESEELNFSDISLVDLSFLDEEKFDLSAITLNYVLKDWISEDDNEKNYIELEKHPSSESLGDFLVKLRNSADYLNRHTRPDVIANIRKTLKDACLNAEFREALFACICDIANTCQDGATYTHTDIEILRSVYCDDLTDKELSTLLIGAKRFSLIDVLAKQKYDALGDVDGKDETETVLFCRIYLSKALNIPINVKKMQWEANAFISNEDLQEIGLEVLSASSTAEQQALILIEHPLWQRQIKMSHKEAIDQITKCGYERFNEIETLCETEEMSGARYLELMNQIPIDRKNSINALIEAKTWEFLSE